MTWEIIVLSTVLFVSLVIHVLVGRFAFRMANIVMNVEDALEESLSLLDSRYASIAQILQKPLFMNSPEVRQVMEDISRSKDAILYVANSLASSIDPEAVEEIEDQQGEQGGV